MSVKNLDNLDIVNNICDDIEINVSLATVVSIVLQAYKNGFKAMVHLATDHDNDHDSDDTVGDTSDDDSADASVMSFTIDEMPQPLQELIDSLLNGNVGRP